MTPTLRSLTDVSGALTDIEGSLTTAAEGLTAAERKIAIANNEAAYRTREERLVQLGLVEPDVSAAEDSAIAAAERATMRVREHITQIESAAPSLPDAEMAQAATLAPMIATDCERLPLDALVREIEAAALRGDRPALLLYLRYGRSRLNTPSAAASERLPNGDASWRQADDRDARMALRRQLADIADQLTSPEAAKVLARAQAIRSTASDLKYRAQKRRNAERRFSFQKPDDVAWES